MRQFKFFHGFTRSIIVGGGVRRLRPTWTREYGDNLNMYHNINAEEELTNVLSQQIADEIDNDIVRALGDVQRLSLREESDNERFNYLIHYINGGYRA